MNVRRVFCSMQNELGGPVRWIRYTRHCTRVFFFYFCVEGISSVCPSKKIQIVF